MGFCVMDNTNDHFRPSKKKPSILTYIMFLMIAIIIGAAAYFIGPPIAHKVMEGIGWYDEENPL